MLNENQFDALLAELVTIRRSLTSIAASLAETSAYQHDDMQDIVASIDSFTLAASQEADSLDD